MRIRRFLAAFRKRQPGGFRKEGVCPGDEENRNKRVYFSEECAAGRPDSSFRMAACWMYLLGVHPM